jgi:hypothetical protein
MGRKRRKREESITQRQHAGSTRASQAVRRGSAGQNLSAQLEACPGAPCKV